MDKCWGTDLGATIYTATTLEDEIPGCMIDDNTGFCECDTANGWYAPLLVSGAVDTTYGGACVPACYLNNDAGG
jgi:hypothetical protein